MKHIEEQLLERSALRPDKLSEAEEKAVKAHLETCAACRETADYLRSFHRDLKELQYAEPPRISKLVRSLFPVPNVILLHPFQHEPGVGTLDTKYTTVLAAMTQDTLEQRFETVATLVSEKENALVRIMHDREENTYKLYVRAEDARKRDHVIVSFPELSTDLVTDQHGQDSFRLPESSHVRNWNSMNAMLHTVVAEYRVVGADLARSTEQTPLVLDDTGEAGITLRLSYGDGTVTLEAQPTRDGAPAITRALVTVLGQTGVLVGLDDGRGQCVT